MTVIVAVVCVIFSLFLLVVGGLAWSGRLPGNGIVGLHVPEVRRSPELWALGHRVAGPFWVLGGLAFFFASALSLIVREWMWILPVLLIVVAIVAVGIGAGQGARVVAQIDAQGGLSQDSQAEGGAPSAAHTPAVDLDAATRAARHANDRNLSS